MASSFTCLMAAIATATSAAYASSTRPRYFAERARIREIIRSSLPRLGDGADALGFHRSHPAMDGALDALGVFFGVLRAIEIGVAAIRRRRARVVRVGARTDRRLEA